MPDVRDDRERGPLQRETERGRVGGDGDVQRSRSLTLSWRRRV
jgi:hypothetical protein